jgi:septal ring factor EnvC (AmiA/AmiB activator)
MPVAITTLDDPTPVPFAKTKEFENLQTAIQNAKATIENVEKAVIAIEAKLHAPPSTNPVQDPAQRAQAALAARGQDDEDLNEMLRIAGLRN